MESKYNNNLNDYQFCITKLGIKSIFTYFFEVLITHATTYDGISKLKKQKDERYTKFMYRLDSKHRLCMHF